MRVTGRGSQLNKIIIFVLLMFLVVMQNVQADENVNYSNCLQYVGGGGLGDVDCYGGHTKSLESENKKLIASIKSSSGIKADTKARLDRYIRAEDVAMKGCALAPRLALDWAIVDVNKNHVDMYDAMESSCRYQIRKQENEFLRNLLSIKTG
ncbi:hypothetical protein [Paraburkholderia tropica]|uniref:hypothetical protein n=1 Tax=Paraburkholderia tropica TaxID=92647 RepID=UPI002ABDEB8A|nr:hypothetical protein [Paraburkholderia tropica]